jgi:2-keto-4-pentenoate hydratase/2-oxohepta-3-ene-1,7-dioic acid hydratase in catechol pathway
MRPTGFRARFGIGAIGAANLLRKYGSLEKAIAASRLVSQADQLRLYRLIATMDKSANAHVFEARRDGFSTGFGLCQLRKVDEDVNVERPCRPIVRIDVGWQVKIAPRSGPLRPCYAEHLGQRLQQRDASAISPSGLDRLRSVDLSGLPRVAKGTRLGVPVTGVANLICIGLNYTDHAEETNAPIPTQPILFNKHTMALSGPYDDVILPPGSTKLDWEVELAIVIGQRCWHVSEEEAPRHIAGYCVLNDISEREYQLEWEGQWTKGKSYPTFAPCGPWLVTTDEVGDPQNLDLWLDLNGKREQTGTTSRMIFSCAHIFSYTSRFMALLPGGHYYDGYAARRWPWPEAAKIHVSRRCHEPRH